MWNHQYILYEGPIWNTGSIELIEAAASLLRSKKTLAESNSSSEMTRVRRKKEDGVGSIASAAPRPTTVRAHHDSPADTLPIFLDSVASILVYCFVVLVRRPV